MPTFQQFPLPDAGEGLTEAEIVAWHVAVGDTVAVNQTIVEIETAKSLVDLPSPWAGVVTRILVEPGQTVDVGTPIIEVDTDPSGAPAGAAVRRARRAAGGAIEHGHRGGGNRHAGVEPGGSDEIEATRAWRAADKPATPEPATPEPATPEPAAREAVLVGYGWPRRARAGATGPPTARRRRDVPAATASQREATRHALAKPPVRKLARELGVDLDSITPTGPGGIVTREDVLGRAAQAEARTLATYPGDDAPWLASGTVSSDGRQTRVPVKSVRKRTAEAMVTSAFTAPHVTVFHTVDVTKTMKLVERLRADREFADVRVTPLLIAAKALMLAVRRHPEINGSWDDGGAGDRLQALHQPRHRGGDAAWTRRAEHQGRAPPDAQGARGRAGRPHVDRPRRPHHAHGHVRRHHHDHQRRGVRHRHGHADPQPGRGRRSWPSAPSASSRGCTRGRSRSATSRSSR